MGIDKVRTRLVRKDQHPLEGSVIAPIFMSSTYSSRDGDRYDDARYTRLGNTPNQAWLCERMAELEGSEAAYIAASGMSAISTALLALVPHGGTVVAQASLYGGTHRLLTREFAHFGRKVRFVPMEDCESADRFAKHLEGEVSAIYVESMSNPLLFVPDLKGIARLAKDRGVLSFIDNTFLSPLFYRPHEHGFDIVLHSATKYLNGHSDLLCGTVSGTKANMEAVRTMGTELGTVLDPFGCWLLERGMKTLAVRMPAQTATAQKVAEALAAHKKVRKVNYPGLPQHPHHARSREWFGGHGGMLSFEVDAKLPAIDSALRSMQLASFAPSLGGVESLVTRPAATSHSAMSPAARKEGGIADELIRFSVGLEAPSDLIADLHQMLEKL